MIDKEMRIRVEGGDEVDNDLVATAIHSSLSNLGFEQVRTHAFNGQCDLEPQDLTTVADMIDRLRPDLFTTAITVISHPNYLPSQPVIVDDHGRERYKTNTIVEYLLDQGPFDMNHLARIPFPLEDRQQFAQLIGYSVAGYDTLSYSPASIRAEAAYEAEQQVERIKHHGAAPMSHTAIEARDHEQIDDETFKVEIEQPALDNLTV